MRSLALLNEDGKEQFGKKELENLIEHYGTDIERAGTQSNRLIHAEKCRSEWSLAKTLVVQEQYSGDSTKRLWKLTYIYLRHALPNMIKLASIFFFGFTISNC